MSRFIIGSALHHDLDRQGRIPLRAELREHAGHRRRQGQARGRGRVPRGLGSRPPRRALRRSCVERGCPPMPSALPIESRRPARGHEPVLADEVVRMLAPAPGRDRRRLHLRRRRPRPPPGARPGRVGPLHRHRPGPRGRRLVRRPRRRRRVRDPLHPGQLRRRPPAPGRPGAARRRDPDGPRPLVDAGRPTRARLLVLAPGPARHADGPLAPRARPPTWWPRRSEQRAGRHHAHVRRGALRPARSPAPSCAAARHGAHHDHRRPGRGGPLGRADAGPLRRRAPGQAGLPGAADRGQRRAGQPRARPRGRLRRCSPRAAAWR